MKKLLYVALVYLIAVTLCSCGSSDNSTPKSKAAAKQSSKPRIAKAVTQEKDKPTIGRKAFEQRLSKLGVPLYQGATFDTIKKTKSGYQATYIIPKTTQEEVKQVHQFYQKHLAGLVSNKGLKKTEMGNLMMFMNGKGKIVFSCANSLNLNGDKHLLILELGEDI